MYTRILIPTDGSELAQAGVAHRLSLAKQHGARVTAMTATDTPGGQFAYSSDLWTPDEAEIAVYEQDQSRAAEAILDTARQCGCDVIVMASHGHSGMSWIMLGSHTAEVLASADIPVVVFR